MGEAPPEPRSDFFVRALAVVGVTGLLHLGLAHGLHALIVASGPAGPPHGAEVVSLAVLATLLAQLGALYLRSQYGGGPADVVRSVPGALRSAAPVTAVLFGLFVMPPALLDEPLRFAVELAPAAAATWSAAHILSIPAKRLLHAAAIRTPGGRVPLGGPPPPLLERSYLRILASASFAAALLALGMAAHRLADASHLDAALLVPGVGLLVFPALAAIAGLSLGQSPGQDILSIARRLDAPPDPEIDQGTATPIVVMRDDEVGELFARLEALRSHLDDDLHRYESVLEQAQEAERTKSDFLNAVSHELRTPLNVVGGFAQLLLEGQPRPLTAAQAEDVGLIRAGGEQLLELITDILDISMIESGDLRLSFSRADVGALVRSTVDFHQPQLGDKPVVLRASVSPGVPAVICDRRRIGQILNNLISNAIKFTEEGEIVVRCAYDPHAERVVIRCIDTGVGIDAEELDTIFEEYRQAGTHARRKKGTGLGLAIARSIAEHHGGTLQADSQVGKGSTFTLMLPLDPPDRPVSIDIAEEHARAVFRRTIRPGELRVTEIIR